MWAGRPSGRLMAASVSPGPSAQVVPLVIWAVDAKLGSSRSAARRAGRSLNNLNHPNHFNECF